MTSRRFLVAPVKFESVYLGPVEAMGEECGVDDRRGAHEQGEEVEDADPARIGVAYVEQVIGRVKDPLARGQDQRWYAPRRQLDREEQHHAIGQLEGRVVARVMAVRAPNGPIRSKDVPGAIVMNRPRTTE